MRATIGSFLLTTLILVTAFSWTAHKRLADVPNIERAEFRVLYSDARNKLDAFSRCHSVVGRHAVKVQIDAQIELQKKFAELKEDAASSGFSDDQQLVDLEIQLKDRNPKSKMEDDAVRCARLSAFALTDQAAVADALQRAETFLDKY